MTVFLAGIIEYGSLTAQYGSKVVCSTTVAPPQAIKRVGSYQGQQRMPKRKGNAKGELSAQSIQESQPVPLQELLRFLSTTAKVPLSSAIAYAGAIVKQKLNQYEVLAKSTPAQLKEVIPNEEHIKTIVRAAKKQVKGGNSAISSSPSKRIKLAESTKEDEEEDPSSRFAITIVKDETQLKGISVTINRAPVMVAFTFRLLLLSKPFLTTAAALSFAQAYSSANAISKGKAIGVIHSKEEKSDEITTLLSGSRQPIMPVMGRSIPFLSGRTEGDYLAIDVAALSHKAETGKIPTHNADTAYNYIQKAFKEHLPQVLGAFDLLLESYLPNMSDEEREDLNKKGYNLYCQFRPEVPYGEKVRSLS